MTAPLPDSPTGDPALQRVLLEIEGHVGRLGWDQPARLFALVNTDELGDVLAE